MKITKIDVFRASCPVESQRNFPIWCGMRIHVKRDVGIFKIMTDEGIFGYSSCSYVEEDFFNHLKDLERTIVEEEASIENVDKIRRKLTKVFPYEGNLNRAMAPIDAAIYDIVAKSEGKGIAELIGGCKRERIKVYASDGLPTSTEEHVEQALSFQEHGFKSYKFRSGRGPGKDVETVKAIRDAVGDDFDILIDAHMWWSALADFSYSSGAVRMAAKEFAKLNVYWLEEPFSPNDLDSYRNLKKAVPNLRLATGEGLKTLPRIKATIESGGVDVLNVSVSRWGYAPFKNIIKLAKAHGVKIIPHTFSTRLESALNVQLCAALPEEVYDRVEHPLFTTTYLGLKSMYPFPLADEIIEPPLVIENDYIKVPNRPGFGAVVDEESLRKYPYIPGPGTYFVIIPSLPIWGMIEPGYFEGKGEPSRISKIEPGYMW